MSRVRSSSRCSTRLSRSSWPTGRRRDIAARRPRSGGVRARGGLVLRARLAGHDLGLGGGGVEVLVAYRLVATHVLVVVVALVLAGDRVLELAHAGPELT